jgi:shikimate 5-dehydrogenase
MCVHQAVEAFRLFTRITPDVAKLQAAYEAREAAFVDVS